VAIHDIHVDNTSAAIGCGVDLLTEPGEVRREN
jgi:hypothetical protein